jgi:DNA-binding transcriptional regulator of glucitol operon
LWFHRASATSAILPHNRATYPESVPRKYAFALRPGWLVLHVVTLAAVITMILLGRWQLHVSEAKHFNLQNFGYTIQWWLFACFACFFWWRIVRDAANHRADAANPTSAEPAPRSEEPVAYRRYVMPTTPEPTDDPQLSAYNDYLAQLAEEDKK